MISLQKFTNYIVTTEEQPNSSLSLSKPGYHKKLETYIPQYHLSTMRYVTSQGKF